ncbi:MAG: SDR family NAD(P)-dependent oxidoreductase [Elusimicrobia bacterium]|nr:SDR family NAD(P)-dependent oxidoreductase [Elusimicrobiota bacterium]
MSDIDKDLLEPVAIVGVGGLFPGSLDIPTYWSNIVGKVDSITEVPKDRWDWHLYYDPDPAAPDKTYSKIGGFVQGFVFDPLKLRIPPPVAAQMDNVQKMAVAATAEALRDSGYDTKKHDPERTAVVLGNSMGGAKKENSDLRVYSAFYQDRLSCNPSFAKLPPATRKQILAEMEQDVKSKTGTITEDTMPGELSNVIAGRVANVFNFNGANFTVDAACASSLAALDQATHGLRAREYDMVVCGGVDQMMTPPAYVKFSKIGALSADGSRPFDAGANGFVMGEGAGVVILKRLSDALRDGDKIYALIRAVGSSSDGRGKGITAPNPKGQRFAIERTFQQLDYAPADVSLLEAHGTSTKVGDVVEVGTAAEMFSVSGPSAGAIALGSVKSQIGHLKAAAGIASLIKTALAIKHKTLPPSINFKTPNPGIDWSRCPFSVVTNPREWIPGKGHPRRANVSSFGFGGTNFHVALEEATASTVARWEKAAAAARARPAFGASTHPATTQSSSAASAAPPSSILNMSPALGGEAFVVHGASPEAVFDRLHALAAKAPESGRPLAFLSHAFNTHSRTGEYSICFAAESADKLKEKVDFILRSKSPSLWEKTPPLFKAKGIYLGRGKKPGKIGFMFPGQGSQYVDMLKDLREKYQVVADTFAEADAIMQEFANYKMTEVLFTKGGETPEQLAAMEERLKQTEITQPAVLTADVALLRLLKSYGVEPDVVCGHSLGEYGALVAADVLSFRDALLAVSARGKEMAGVKVKDCGKMASIAAPVEKVEPVLKKIPGYVAPANKNCPIQTVIAGESQAVEAAIKKFGTLGIQAQEIRVSHAFHSKIVEPAQVPYAKFLDRLPIRAPKIPVLSNVSAAYFPEDGKGIRQLMVTQIAHSVEFIRQTERMYKDGVRLFVEVGPKRVLTAFVTSTLEGKSGAATMSSNHPKRGGILEFNDLLAHLEAEGVRVTLEDKQPETTAAYTPAYASWINGPKPEPARQTTSAPAAGEDRPTVSAKSPSDWQERWNFFTGPVVVSGIAAGTPGGWDRVFREGNLDDVLRGQNFIGKLSDDDLQRQIDKNIVRLIKSATGDHRLERIESAAEVVHLAATAGEFDLAKEFGVKESMVKAMDVSSRLAVAAGILALKDAGIPLVSTYKETTTGSTLHTGWRLPEEMRGETGVIFATSYPSIDSMASEVARYLADKYRRRPLRELAALIESLISRLKDPEDRAAVLAWHTSNFKMYQDRYGHEGPYEFSRDFLLRVMPLGHSQLAQWIGALGPAAQISAACASTTQAVGMAEDWIRLGRAKRVIVIAGDDVTSPNLREWIVTGFLTAGAATTTKVVSEAALPFDKRRHGMILGMGASALVVEQGAKVAERGMRPLTEILATQFKNSAFHATRLDVDHVAEVMERLMVKAERRWGISRRDVAAKALFMSHETHTPARGGSAAAEVTALKRTFGDDVSRIIVANTKGFTGHSMGASIEDPVAIRALVTGIVPPIANYRVPDPELAGITLSRGGEYDLEYAIRLGAGFGSQIAMTLMKRVLRKGESRISDPARHQEWLRRMSKMKDARLEVVSNTLRVHDSRLPSPNAVPYSPAPVEPVPAVAVRSDPAPAASAAAAPAHAPAPSRPKHAPSGRGSVSEAEVRATVVRVVGEKTGYPAEMLELDLDMEADLGIDTVKQAELFGMIHERYEIPRNENVALKDYPTLRHVIRFVLESKGASASESPSEGGAAAVAEPPASENGHRAHASPAASAPVEPPAAAPAGPAPDDEDVRKAVIELVGAKTGYPAEMLELDLDMEADLGIDTVKQAEMFGLLREKYSIPKRENLALKDYPTLRHLIRFILESRGGSDGAVAAVESAQDARRGPAEFKRWAIEAYPAAEAKTARTLAKDRHVLILAADAASAKPFADAFKKLGVPSAAVTKLDWKDEAAAGQALRKAAAGKPIQGIVYAPGLSLPAFDAAKPAAFDKQYRGAVRPLFIAAKALRAELNESGRWLVVLTGMGGTHGAPEAGAKTAAKGKTAPQPVAGALAGLTKALRKELPNARVVSLDVDPSDKKTPAADAAVAELTRGDGQVEIGRAGGKRWAIRLAPKPVSGKTFKLGPDSTVVVTGGGQGLGAECAKALAHRLQCRLVILGRTPLDPKAEKWAALDASGLNEHKKKLWETLKADKTKKATPAILEREFSKVTKAVALHRNIEAMRLAGSEVVYVAVDVADESAVSKALKARKVRPDAVLHAAGLEESKLLADKTLERFDAVFAAKAHGAINLLAAMPPKAGQRWVFFSSVVGRFGNLGQTDYAAASDFLPKLCAHLSREGVSAVTVDLTAISDIGMATRGGVEQFLKSQGVDFMPPATVVKMVLDELLHDAPATEVLLAGRLGKIDPDGQMQERPGVGGRDSEVETKANGAHETTAKSAAAKVPAAADNGALPAELKAGGGKVLSDQILSQQAGVELVTRKEFSLKSDPWLKDHSIAGVPYVAGVMGLELFAETEATLTGKAPRGFSDVRFALPIKLLRDKPIAVRTYAKSAAAGRELRIESDFLTPQGIKLGAPRVHFTAKTLKEARSGWAGMNPPKAKDGSFVVKPEAIYAAYFHGPSFQVLAGIASLSEDEVLALYQEPSKLLWEKSKTLLFHPMLIEAAFQACGYRDLHFSKKMTLPDSIGAVQVFGGAIDKPKAPRIYVRYKGADKDGKSVYDAYVFEANGRLWVELTDYKMIAVS